jgi:hypothetical protein
MGNMVSGGVPQPVVPEQIRAPSPEGELLHLLEQVVCHTRHLSRACVCNRAAMAHTRWSAVNSLPNPFFSYCAIAAFAHLR